MHHVMALYGTPTDPDHFRRYYVGTHLPLAAALPGLKAMHYSFDVAMLTPGEGYFCTWTGTFDDAAAADLALGSAEGEALANDVPHYASGGMTLLRYTAISPSA